MQQVLNEEIILNQIKECLDEVLEEFALDMPNDYELLSFIDSLSVVDIVVNLEGKLNMAFADEDLVYDNFKNVDSIFQVVKNRLNSSEEVKKSSTCHVCTTTLNS